MVTVVKVLVDALSQYPNTDTHYLPQIHISTYHTHISAIQNMQFAVTYKQLAR